VKGAPEEQKHFTQRRKGVEGATKTRQFFWANLCVLGPEREVFGLCAVSPLGICEDFMAEPFRAFGNAERAEVRQHMVEQGLLPGLD
jgi:hypothetical protein